MYCNFCNKKRKSQKLKYIYFFKKCLFVVYSKCGLEYVKIFKEEQSLEMFLV